MASRALVKVSLSKIRLCINAELYSHNSSSTLAEVARASQRARCSAGWLGWDGSITTSSWRSCMGLTLTWLMRYCTASASRGV